VAVDEDGGLIPQGHISGNGRYRPRDAAGGLYRRIPTLRLATTMEQLKFKHDGAVYGVYELPVTW
jgi:hypothetical protein